MKIPRESQVKFYELHLKKMEDEYRQYLFSEAFSLYKNNDLYAGKYIGFDEKRGNILVRFKSDRTPRRKMLFTCFGVPSEFAAPRTWGQIMYHALRKKASGGIVSDATSIYFTEFKEDPSWIIVGFSNVELNLFDKLKRGNTVVFARHEPPREYLLSLIDLTKKLPIPNPVMDIETEPENWHPVHLSSKDNIPKTIDDSLSENEEIIIQGPPGTGKTYLIAQLCSKYLQENKSVMVTALTNRALMEVADKKEHLDEFLNRRRVYKASLSTGEKKENKNLERLEKVTPIMGSLILCTYYNLSKQARKYPNHPIFDVVIIEEASQAFLGTIAIFQLLARKLIVIGDPVQLPPIWDEGLVQHLHEKIRKVAHGLETYAYCSNTIAYRLTETYRLPERGAALTGIFYEHSLVSVSKNQPPFTIRIPEPFKKYLNPEGGASALFINLSVGGKRPPAALKFLEEFLSMYEIENPSSTLAILSPFKKTNSYIQANLYPKCKTLENIYIETIDRIQGLTSDFVIFLIPFGGNGFSTYLNRFNVATSRSKSHTLIILDKSFESIPIARNGLVNKFFKQMN